MRIVLIGGGVHPIPPTGYGAIERILTDLATALRAAGHEVEILNRVRHRRMRDEYPFAREIPGLLRKTRWDVLHAHTPVVANRLALGGYPFVYTSHSRHWYYRERLSHRWGYWLERRAVRKATRVIALTEALARTMRSAVRPPLPPIRVVPFGVDTERFAPRWSARTGGHALGVGVIAPFKRWHLAAEAIRGTGATLRIAGPIVSQEYAASLRAIGPEVELLGEVSEVELERLFAESDFLVHPSAVEILSATVLEGLAAGLPVLGGPALEGVVDSGVDGWVVAGEGPALVSGLRDHARVLVAEGSRRRAMGEAARRAALDRYSWPRVVEQHLEVYRSVTGGSPDG